MTFQKHDAGKLRLDLISPEFLEGLGAILTLGAAKYAAENWKQCPEPFERYYSALQRHLVAFAKGQRVDKESGLSHLYHAAACIQFLEYFERIGAIGKQAAPDPELSAEDVADVWRVPLTGPA